MKFFVIAAIILLTAMPASAPPVQITISQPADATTIDPGRSTQVLTVNYFYNLYDTLTRWDSSLRLQPALATPWKHVNETTWEFTIRQGVKFHDGAPLTVEDVKATLERNLQPGKTVVMEMGARRRMLNERTVPANGLLLGNPQATLLDAARQSLATLAPERVQR
jgi:ABC-type transport system substrate-binding protein